MNDPILLDLLRTYEKQRETNAAQEASRHEKATRACPEITVLMEARQAMIFDFLRNSISTQTYDASDDLVARMESYNQKLRELLIESGFPSDYLQPVFRCLLCKDTGYIETPLRERCICLQATYKEMVESQKDTLFSTAASFDSYDETRLPDTPLEELPMSQRAYTNALRNKCLAYAQAFPNTRTPNLLFVGQSGLGKTFLLQAIAKHVAEKGFHVECIGSFKLIEDARKAYFANQTEYLNHYFQCDLLLIDDLGTEPLMENITIPHLFQVIDRRLQNAKHTIISTNFNVQEIKARYTERIASRMLDARRCEIFAFFGRDIRLM